MRLLIVHPGADWSVSDLFDGYAAAFRTLGHDVGVYNLSARIEVAHGWLHYCWRKAGRAETRPGPVETIYRASLDVVNAALIGDVDWVFVISGMYLHPDALIMLRRAGRRVALLLTESPYEDDRQIRVARLADVVFTNERTSVRSLGAVNPNVYYLPHAYDPKRHRPAPREEGGAIGAQVRCRPSGDTLSRRGSPEAAAECCASSEPRSQPGDSSIPAHDVVFVGTGFQERLDILGAVDWAGIDLGLYGTYELMGSRSKLRQFVRGKVVSNEFAAALYRRAKIGLNLYRQSVHYHRDSPRITTAESVNPRALELAACGVFTISDYRPEVEEVFGGLVPTFTTPQQLQKLLSFWLADETGRQTLASGLPGRVARSAFYHRAKSISDLLMGDSASIIGYDDRTGAAPAGAHRTTREACLAAV